MHYGRTFVKEKTKKVRYLFGRSPGRPRPHPGRGLADRASTAELKALLALRKEAVMRYNSHA